MSSVTNSLFNIKRPLQMGDEGAFESDPDINTVVKQNLKSLLLTKKGERPILRGLGCDLWKRLFESKTDGLKISIAEDIKSATSQWMNYVNIDTVSVYYYGEKIANKYNFITPPSMGENDVYVIIEFSFNMQNKTIKEILDLTLEGTS